MNPLKQEYLKDEELRDIVKTQFKYYVDEYNRKNGKNLKSGRI